MGVWLGPRGANADKKAPVFESTGTLGTDYLYDEETVNGVTRWEIAVLRSCSFTFRRVGKVDMTLVGAGENGGTAKDESASESDIYGGDGGDGGMILRLTEQTIPRGTALPVSIGQTGGAATTFNGESSASGQAGKTGATGARCYGPAWQIKNAGSANDGELPFLSGASRLFPGVLFGPSGGGGAATNKSYNTGATYNASASSGGDTGGGDGGTKGDSTKNGKPGEANRGAGGGGAYGTYQNGGSGTGGAGGSGILLIRGSITA